MRLKRKGQTVIEFVILVIFLLFFFTVFFISIQEKSVEKESEKTNLLVQEVARDIQNEINLAATSSEGYSRDFELPSDINEKDYNVALVGNLIYISTTDGKSATALPVHEVNGNITKGKNTIRKQNGEIFLND